MNHILMYAAGCPFTPPQTGGNKRFCELAKFLFENYNADICCGDDKEILEQYEVNAKYHMRKSSKKGVLPPEAWRLLENRNVVHMIKLEKYSDVIVFDVPPAIGLSLSGVKNIILMIRKDLIGYESIANGSKRKKLKKLYMLLSESICLLNAKKVIVQCEYDKEQLLDRHRFLKSRIENKFYVQINNVNPSWIRNNSFKDKEYKKLNDEFRICFIGNFNDNRKGHDILLEVAAEIIKVYNIAFDIIGGGVGLEYYRDNYRDERIIFHGRLSNPMNIMKGDDLVVVPSLADSCPNTVMEALYNKVPVIGSRRGGIPEILLDESALFELDKISLKEKIIDLYINKNKLAELKRKQADRYQELCFDWAERITKIIIEEKE